MQTFVAIPNVCCRFHFACFASLRFIFVTIFAVLLQCYKYTGTKSPFPLPSETIFTLISLGSLRNLKQAAHCKDTILKMRNKYSQKRNCATTLPIPTFLFLGAIYIFPQSVSRVLAGRPAGRTDASAPLSAGAASPPPPPVGMEGGESAAHEFTS